MTRGGKRVPIPRAQARTYLDKARQFALNARDALDGARFDAALLDAVHAGISAGDAVTVVLGGERSTDPDHMRLADLIEEHAGTGEDSRAHAKPLRLLVNKKNLVEYEARRATQADAREGVERADRLVSWAGRVVDKART